MGLSSRRRSRHGIWTIGSSTCRSRTGRSSRDDLWREYFRYFLHYQNTSTDYSVPPPNLLRIWIVDENFGLEKAYDAWKAHPVEFWRAFDRLVYYSDRAGVYLCPVLGHMS